MCTKSSGALIIFIVYLSIDCGTGFTLPKNETAKREKIIGGSFTRIQEAAYHVQLLTGKTYFCGGSLVTKKHVVTAAHCIEMGLQQAEPIKVLAGSDQLNKGIEGRRVSSYVMHPGYSKDTISDTDIGVITLDKPFKSPEIHTVDLPTRPVRNGERVRATGFGLYDYFSQSPSSYLKKYDSVVSVCPEFANDLCVKTEYGNGMCFGDSGSGLINSNGELIGVTSRISTYVCAAGEPDVFTSVYGHLNLIRQAIGDFELDEKPGKETKDDEQYNDHVKEEVTQSTEGTKEEHNYIDDIYYFDPNEGQNIPNEYFEFYFPYWPYILPA